MDRNGWSELSEPQAQPVIELRDVSVRFPPEPPLLKGINLKVFRGETLVFIGPGATGKTVLLKTINGLIKPSTGKVLVKGRDLAALRASELAEIRRVMGMSFQSYALFDSMTVFENVGFYLLNHSDFPEEEIRKRVKDILEEVRLFDVEHLKPVELSGGMRKRVGLARSMVHKPEIVLLDEPTAGLDPISAAAISKMINQLKRQLSMTVVAVSNEMAVARRIAHRIAMIWDGRIHAIGPAAEILRSHDPAVRQFVTGSKDGPIPTLV